MDSRPRMNRTVPAYTAAPSAAGGISAPAEGGAAGPSAAELSPGDQHGGAHSDSHFGGPHIGIDEAGRGCLAGPVVAAAVLFTPGFDFARVLPGLDDSKKLSEARRGTLAAAIRELSVAWGIGLSWQDEIDRINIRNATFRAMTRAVLGLFSSLERDAEGGEGPGGAPLLMVDGNAVIPAAQWQACCGGLPPGAEIWERFLPPSLLLQRAAHGPEAVRDMPEQKAVVDGDALVPSISAASVLAKTGRDELLVRLDEEYPGYGLARHKGYGTREHLGVIAAKGPCDLHRRTFRGVRPEQEQLRLL